MKVATAPGYRTIKVDVQLPTEMVTWLRSEFEWSYWEAIRWVKIHKVALFAAALGHLVLVRRVNAIEPEFVGPTTPVGDWLASKYDGSPIR